MRKRFFTTFVITIFIVTVSATAVFSQSHWQIEARTLAPVSTSGDLPLWFHSNQYGIYDSESSNLLQGFSLQRAIEDRKHIDIGFGADVIGRFSSNSQVFLNELYGEAKLGVLRFYAGKKKWEDGVWSSDLSLGSMIWSGNAATMPKVMLQIPQYTDVPLTNEFVAFRGYFSHGWFGADRYVEGTYLHEKALYIRILPEEFPINGHGGIIHNVQWGGDHPTLGQLPDGLGDYWRVFSGRAGEQGTSPGGEVINALGNTVGAYEARLDVDLNTIDITAYRQFFIETSVSTRFRSPWDGQWGVNLELADATSGLVKSLLWEHLNTKKQNAKEGETIGADQYYHNFIYRNGWSYKGRILGSPLVSLGEFQGRNEVINNIILAHHLGMDGEISTGMMPAPINYQLKATYSRSYGRTNNCSGDFCDENDPQVLRTERRDQWYFQFQLSNQVSRTINIQTALALDSGDLSNEFGFFVGIKYLLLGDDF